MEPVVMVSPVVSGVNPMLTPENKDECSFKDIADIDKHVLEFLHTLEQSFCPQGLGDQDVDLRALALYERTLPGENLPPTFHCGRFTAVQQYILNPVFPPSMCLCLPVRLLEPGRESTPLHRPGRDGHLRSDLH